MGTARLRNAKRWANYVYTHINTVYVSAINRQTDHNTCIKSKQIHVDRTDRQTETDRHIDGQTYRQEGKKDEQNRDRQTR